MGELVVLLFDTECELVETCQQRCGRNQAVRSCMRARAIAKLTHHASAFDDTCMVKGLHNLLSPLLPLI